MQTFVVILDRWPPKDPVAAGAAMAGALGGAPINRAMHLRACRGIAAEGLDGREAVALAAALSDVGFKAWQISADLVPRLPKALTSRRLDPTGDETLLAHVRMTGPPEELPWRRVLLAVPAFWEEVRQVRARPAPKGRSLASTAMSLAMTGGVGLLFDKKKGGDEAAPTSKTSADPMIELVVAGPPLRRYHAFASRMDYSALGATSAQRADNWRTLLAALRRRLRPEVTGGGMIDRFLAGTRLPRALWVSDANDLGRTTRWLMLRAALRRMEARGGG